MPWENRFEVKTASQTNCYRQLIQKEALRRRNDAAILQRYRFHDHVTSLEGLGSHWDGTVVAPTQTRSRPASAADTAPLQGKRALLQQQSRSTVLQEGYAYDQNTIASMGRVTLSRDSSVAGPAFARLNPEAANPRTLARLRAQNKAAAEAAAAERAAASNRARSAVERAHMLKARLSSVNAKGAYAVDDLAAVVAENANADDVASQDAAVADVAPTSAPCDQLADKRSEAPKNFGLRSCFLGSRRPVSAANCQRLATQAKSVFEPAPALEHVTAARERLRTAQQQREARSPLPSALARATSAPPRRGSETPHTAMSSSASVAVSPEHDVETSHRLARRLQRIDELESQLDETRAERARVHSELAALCEKLEVQQQRTAAHQPRRRK